MKKVLERGYPQQYYTKCKSCGCKFSFCRSDVCRYVDDTISCPECMYDVKLEKDWATYCCFCEEEVE